MPPESSTAAAPAAGPALDAALVSTMRQYWGYDSFRPLQQEAMQAAIEGRDSVVVLPTGGGKSLCFQVPAVAMGGMALVVSPLIALMKDQVDALRNNGVSAAFINSTLSEEQRRSTASDIRAGKIKLLYVAPERLLKQGTLSFLQSCNVSLAAIDEAHCISSWGHDFRPEYRGLRILKQAFPNIGIHAYTATASERVRADIAEQLGLENPAMLVGSFDRSNLTYRVRRGVKKWNAIAEFVGQRPGDSGIVYCISRREVDDTAAGLKALGVKVAPYHAGMSDIDRQRNQEAFLEERIDVIVATVAFGMGIDKPNVRYVLHSGMPKSLEAYQQESGRAGRDGLEAECTLLYSGGDAMKWKQMIQNSGETGSGEGYEGAMTALAAMDAYCCGVNCRHAAIVGYFGQDLGKANCGACDVCLGELDLVEEPLVPAQKILSCILRLDQRFGADYTAKVLTGSSEARIVGSGHDKLSTYGLLKNEGAGAVRDWIEQLVGQGMARREGEYDTLAVTERGWQVLRGQHTPRLLRPAVKKSASRAERRGPAGDSWEGVDRGLFEHLRLLRNEHAAEASVPAYIVFGDDALRDMARRRPTSLESFRQCKGVGDKKLADYGEEFTTAIHDYCVENSLDTNVGPEVVKPVRNSDDSDGPALTAGAMASFKLFRAGKSLGEVAAEMGRANSTVVGYLNQFLTHHSVIDPTPWVEPKIARRIEGAIESVGLKGLKPIYEQLGGEVSYDEIRIVATCVSNRGG